MRERTILSPKVRDIHYQRTPIVKKIQVNSICSPLFYTGGSPHEDEDPETVSQHVALIAEEVMVTNGM